MRFLLDAWRSATDSERRRVKLWLMPEDDPESIALHVIDHPGTRSMTRDVYIEWYEVDVYDVRTGVQLCHIVVRPTAQGDELAYTW